MSDLWDGVGVDRRIEGGDLRACYHQKLDLLPGMFSKKFLTNDSNPWGACITELGGSSSSEFGLELGAVFLVSS